MPSWWVGVSVLSVLAVVSVVGWNIVFALRAQRAMKQTARAYQLMWLSTGPFAAGEVQGIVAGIPFSVRVQHMGFGSLARTVTVLEAVIIPGLPFEGYIRKQDVGTTIEALLGNETVDYVMGDPHFDGCFQITVRNPQSLHACLPSEARRALQEAAQSASDVLLTPTRLRWVGWGAIHDARTLTTALQQMGTAITAIHASLASNVEGHALRER